MATVYFSLALSHEYPVSSNPPALLISFSRSQTLSSAPGYVFVPLIDRLSILVTPAIQL